MSTQLTRRSIAKAGAWSVPALTLGTAAPAVAASLNCGTPKLNIGWNLTYDYGTDGVLTTQTLKFSDLLFQVVNLAPGVTVTSVQWGMWIDIRVTSGNGSPWQNNGLPYPQGKVRNDSTVPVVTQPTCYGGTTCGWGTMTWSGGTIGGTGLVTGGTKKTFRDGSVRPAWQLKETWTNTGSNYSASNTTTCGVFQTGKMGVVNGTGTGRTQVAGTSSDASWFSYTSTQLGPNGAYYTDYQTYHGAIAYLSDGTTVTFSNSSVDATPWI